MANRTRSHITVNRQLFARHSIKRKPGADLGHATSTFGDHNEIHDNQDAKHDQSQKDRAPHDEHGKTLDDPTCGIRASVTIPDNQLGGGDIQ